MVYYNEIKLQERFGIGINGSPLDLLKATEVLDEINVSWAPISVGEEGSRISIGFDELFAAHDKLENVYPIIYQKTDPALYYMIHRNFLGQGVARTVLRVKGAVDKILEEDHPLKEEDQIECLVFSILTGVINDLGYSKYFIQVISEYLGEILGRDSFRGKAMKILY